MLIDPNYKEGKSISRRLLQSISTSGKCHIIELITIVILLLFLIDYKSFNNLYIIYQYGYSKINII